MKKRAKPDDTQAPTHVGLSQGNAFTLPSGLSWNKQNQSRVNSVTGTANREKRLANGDDPGKLHGLSKKSDENLRVRAEQQRAARARFKA